MQLTTHERTLLSDGFKEKYNPTKKYERKAEEILNGALTAFFTRIYGEEKLRSLSTFFENQERWKTYYPTKNLARVLIPRRGNYYSDKCVFSEEVRDKYAEKYGMKFDGFMVDDEDYFHFAFYGLDFPIPSVFYGDEEVEKKIFDDFKASPELKEIEETIFELVVEHHRLLDEFYETCKHFDVLVKRNRATTMDDMITWFGKGFVEGLLSKNTMDGIELKQELVEKMIEFVDKSLIFS